MTLEKSVSAIQIWSWWGQTEVCFASLMSSSSSFDESFHGGKTENLWEFTSNPETVRPQTRSPVSIDLMHLSFTPPMEHPAQTQMASKLTHVATGAVSRCSFADRVHTNIFGLDAQSTNIVGVLHQSAVRKGSYWLFPSKKGPVSSQ